MIKSKRILIATLIVLVFVGIMIYLNTSRVSQSQLQVDKNPASSIPSPTQNESAKIVSTKPDLLSDAIIPSDQIIEITFNKSLSFAGEFKHRLDPEIAYSLELSADKKSIKIIPDTPYELGLSFTLIILGETKFTDGSRLNEEKIYHFRTVKFRGL